MKNRIGIESGKAELLSKKLNLLLANYQVFYMNTRGFHWNIRGGNFFELHAKFEELYDDLILKVDEIAERVLTLGFTPSHSFTDYLAVSDIKEAKSIDDGKVAVKNLLSSFSTIIGMQRDILELAGDAQDEGTSALMSDYIREQEKLVWMLSAYLNE